MEKEIKEKSDFIGLISLLGIKYNKIEKYSSVRGVKEI
jgi:hypothetical protein